MADTPEMQRPRTPRAGDVVSGTHAGAEFLTPPDRKVVDEVGARASDTELRVRLNTIAVEELGGKRIPGLDDLIALDGIAAATARAEQQQEWDVQTGRGTHGPDSLQPLEIGQSDVALGRSAGSSGGAARRRTQSMRHEHNPKRQK